MDIATLVGLITCGVMVFLGIVTGPGRSGRPDKEKEKEDQLCSI